MSNKIKPVKKSSQELTTAQQLIYAECNEIADLLIKKNIAYGNSFAEPINIFCKLPSSEQLNVRIDDKLNRIAKGRNKESVPEDTEKDLIGYLILKRVLRRVNQKNTALIMPLGENS